MKSIIGAGVVHFDHQVRVGCMRSKRRESFDGCLRILAFQIAVRFETGDEQSALNWKPKAIPRWLYPSRKIDWMLGTKGDAVFVEVSREFKELSRAKFEDSFHASPAFASGRIYLRGATNLWCLGKQMSEPMKIETANAH